MLSGYIVKIIPACSGVLAPFLQLQDLQAHTKLTGSWLPFCDCGIMWSMVLATHIPQ
jgi:hypothetical protein